MKSGIISVKKIIIKDDLRFNDTTLLSYKIEYPEFTSSDFGICLTRVNRFYRNKALEYQQYCKTKLFRIAVEQYKESIKNDFPIREFEVMQVCNVTYLQACIISLYYDRYEYLGGAHGSTVRASQTWHLQKCRELTLEQFVHCPPDYKTYVFSQIKAQINCNQEMYFKKYNVLLVKTFNKNSFYCAPEGIVIYYQQYDIAPYSGGIREFLIPYSNCVLNPEKLCCC